MLMVTVRITDSGQQPKSHGTLNGRLQVSEGISGFLVCLE